MNYIADGFNTFQEYHSLEEAIHASKNAPWANGGVYASTDGYIMCPEFIVNPSRFLNDIN